MYRQRSTLECLAVTPDGRFLRSDLSYVLPDDVEEVCDTCEEPAYTFDGLGTFRNPDVPGGQLVVHGTCAAADELELA